MGPDTAKQVPTLDEIKREVHTVCESPLFSHSRQAKLLDYLCNKALLGQADQIKAVTIAMEVFGRPWSFDESKDAIVRVEAHRLRRKLTKYYEEEGAGGRVRIVLTPGSYVPEFVVNDTTRTHIAEEPKTAPVEVVTAPSQEPRPRPGVLLFSVGGLVVAVAVLMMLLVQRAHTKDVTGSSGERMRLAPVAAAAGADNGIRILAGRTKADYVDRFGHAWSTDRYFSGGAAEPGPTDFYGRPPDAGLFRTMRSGEFSYDVPVSSGVYELRLYWAEPIFRLANESNGGGENERRFQVSLNGKPLLSSFDVVADSGTSPVDIRTFKDVTPDSDGKVHIRFTANYGTPFLNGLELVPSVRGRANPIRIRAHDLSFTDHEGKVWSPDNYYIGGRFATHKQAVDGTPDPELYAGERYGNFSYAIPVPNGKYAVTLHFAETWFRPDTAGQDKGGKGDRIFDVYCNGTTLLKDLDVFAQSGPFRPLVRTFHGIRPNGQGKILLSFSPGKNYAAVKAIEVVEER